MEINKKIARLIFPHFRFGESKLEDAVKLVEMGVGGFCLYGGSVDDVKYVISELRSRSNHYLIFCADYENGVGQWVNGATVLPSNMAIAATGNPANARRKAEITAVESEILGVDWVFAPVLDLASNHDNPIVNLRAFSDNINTVTEFAREYINGLNSLNILNSLKHFPGHGDTSVDSHLTMPVINKKENELYETDIKPFISLSDMADSIMVGHLKVPSLDESSIASFSRRVMKDIIRDKIKFNGVIITDALMMKAINDEVEAGVRAFISGADILLYPQDPYRLYRALLASYNKRQITDELIDMAIARQDMLVKKRNLSDRKLSDYSLIGSCAHREFVKDIALDSITWVKKIENIDSYKKIYYTEVPQEDEFKSEVFVNELKSYGYEFVNSIEDADVVYIGVFTKPKAFSGKINLDEKSKKFIEKILYYGKKTLMISFGSPFVFDKLVEDISGGICCFSDIDVFMKELASGIALRKQFKGKLPVRIYE